MKKRVEKQFHTIPCSGCGKYKKEVNRDVKEYFCSFCFTGSPNYLRHKHNKPMLIPLDNIKKGDVVEDYNGKSFKILRKAYVFKETTYYYGYSLNDKKKEEVLLGDYQLVRKLGK